MIAYVTRDWQTHGMREVDTDGILWSIAIGDDNGGRMWIMLDGQQLECGVDWFWDRAEAEAEIERLKGLA